MTQIKSDRFTLAATEDLDVEEASSYDDHHSTLARLRECFSELVYAAVIVMLPFILVAGLMVTGYQTHRSRNATQRRNSPSHQQMNRNLNQSDGQIDL